MAFKINLGTKDGKTYKLEVESEELIGKELKDKVKGTDVSPQLSGYELQITGASDKSGFTSMEDVEGFGLNRVLLNYGKGMHIRPKGLKKKPRRPAQGMRLRKTVRGKVISNDIVQINMKVLKEGAKPLAEIFASEAKAE